MNIYDFFNSPDVAEHCQSIGHKFNAVESAVMISQSKTRTLAEKHAAYRTIIAEYPDMEIPKALNHGHIKSFHKALGDIIAHEERILERFLSPEPNTIYQARVCYKAHHHHSDEELELFTNYEKALADAMKALNWSVFKDDPTVFRYFRIKKRYFDSENSIEAIIPRSGEITELFNYGIIKKEKDNEFNLLESCYIDVPVPFKKGDLVEDINNGNWMGNVYVLRSICRDNAEYHAKWLEWTDISDMNAYVYYEYDGSVHCESIFYPDLQYCKRELKNEKRILKYVSLYMQEKLCLCSLLQIQKYLLADELKDELKKHDFKSDLENLGDKLLDE